MPKMEKPQNPKRAELITLSNEAKELRETMEEASETENEALFWASKTINYMLLNHMYNTDGAREFNTFKQWKKQGATVKKGSKAFLVWGQPIYKKNDEDKEEENPNDPEEEYKYFPLCYLFSDKQVITAEELSQEREETQKEKVSKAQEPTEKFFNSVKLDIIL